MHFSINISILFFKGLLKICINFSIVSHKRFIKNVINILNSLYQNVINNLYKFVYSLLDIAATAYQKVDFDIGYSKY